MWNDFLEAISSNSKSFFGFDMAPYISISSVSCFIIFVWFLIEFLILYIPSKKLKKDMKKAVAALSYNSENDIDSRRWFFKNFKKINETLCGLKYYSHAWKEFNEHLIRPPSDTPKEECEYRNSISPEIFFSSETIIYENINEKHCEAVPGYLTGLGVLGTFLGFLWGLTLFTKEVLNDKGFDLDNTAFKEGIEGLLGGASTAFWTSVFGISFSIVYSMFEKWQLRKLENLVRTFVDKLEKCLKFTTQEQQQEKMIEEVRNSSDSFQEIIDLLEQVRNSSDSFINNFISKLEQSFTTMLETHIVENINRGSKSIIDAVSSIKDIQENSQKEFIEKVTNQIAETLKIAVTDAQSNATEKIGNITHFLQESVAEMLEAQTKSREANEKLLSSISQSTGIFIDDVKKGIGNIMDEFDQQTISNQEKMNEQLNQIMMRIGEATSKSTENIESRLDQSAKNISAAFDQIGDKFLNLAEKVEKSGEKYEESSHRISTSAEIFRSTMGSLQENLSTMKEIANSQLSIATSNQNSIDSLVVSLKHIEELSSTIRSQNEVMGDLINRLNEEREFLQSSTRSLTEHWQEYTDRFTEVDKSLEKVFSQIRKGNDEFVDQYNNLTEEASKSVSQISNTLSGAIIELNDAIRELRDVLTPFNKES